MNRKLGIGIAAAVIGSGLVYLYKKANGKKRSAPAGMARTRHRTEVFARAKAQQAPLEGI